MLVAFVLIAPVGWLSWLSVRDSSGFTFRNYSRMLVNSGYASSLETTLEVAALVTVLSTVLAYPVALLLARLRGWQARLVLAIVLLPLWTSLLVRTFAWLVLLQRHGLINSALLTLGIIDAPLALVNNLTGTVIGMTHVMTPFVVLPVTASLQAVDPLLYRAAQSLGANRWRAFWGVVFPLSLSGVVSGVTLVFVMSLGFYVMPSFLGGGSLRMWSNRIQTNIEVYPDWGAASALGVVLLIVTIAVLVLSWRLMALVLARGGADARA
jgi:ABC-type spermidine/putrescine transport system permease subunit I